MICMCNVKYLIYIHSRIHRRQNHDMYSTSQTPIRRHTHVGRLLYMRPPAFIVSSYYWTGRAAQAPTASFARFCNSILHVSTWHEPFMNELNYAHQQQAHWNTLTANQASYRNATHRSLHALVSDRNVRISSNWLVCQSRSRHTKRKRQLAGVLAIPPVSNAQCMMPTVEISYC